MSFDMVLRKPRFIPPKRDCPTVRPAPSYDWGDPRK